MLGCKTSNRQDVRQTFKLVHGVGIPPFPWLHLSIPVGPGRQHIIPVALCARRDVRGWGVSMGLPLDLQELQSGLSVGGSEGARGAAHIICHHC